MWLSNVRKDSARSGVVVPDVPDDVPVEGAGVVLLPAVDGETNRDAAWFYETPKSAAAQIEGRVAFWRGVTVTA